jgi:hypothetical protein
VSVNVIRVIDISASAGVPPLAWFERIQQPPYDVRGIIIECWNNGRVANYHACAELADRAGLPRATYGWPPSGATRAIAYVRSERQPDPLFFVLDVERPEGVSAEFCALRREHVAAVREAGLAPWVYSSAREWALVMGDDASFADLPLWKAAYVSGAGWPDAPPSLPVPAAFGGWGEALGWQLHGTTLLDGVPVDLSLFDAAAFARRGEEDEMNYPLPHVDWRPPVGKPYRSYYMSNRGGVVEKQLVVSAEHRQALVAAGVIREPPTTLSLEQLKAIPSAPGTPEPDAI